MTAIHEQAPAATSDRGELLAEAIRVLTAAARLTRPVLERDEEASTTSGAPVWRESGRSEPDDWAEFVSQALAGAAANVGGVETALAGRPGSWEADFARQMLTGTVGHAGEYLWEHRTEPVRITLYVDEILVDVGGWNPYWEAQQELGRRLDGIPDGTEEYERAVDEVGELEDRLEEQRLADWAVYGEALKAAVVATAARKMPGLAVPVEVTVDLETFRSGRDEPYWPDLEWELTGEAIAATSMPGAGRTPLERLHDEAQP